MHKRSLLGLQNEISRNFEAINCHALIVSKLIDAYAILDKNGSKHYSKQLDHLNDFIKFYSKRIINEPTPSIELDKKLELMEEDEFILENHIAKRRYELENNTTKPKPTPKPVVFTNICDPSEIIPEEEISEEEIYDEEKELENIRNDFLSKLPQSHRENLLETIYEKAFKEAEEIFGEDSDKKEEFVSIQANKILDIYIESKGTITL